MTRITYMTTETTDIRFYNGNIYDMLDVNTKDLLGMYENDSTTIEDYDITCEYNSYHWEDMEDIDRSLYLLISKKVGNITTIIEASYGYTTHGWDVYVTDVRISDIYL